jgi:hypothetical protein
MTKLWKRIETKIDQSATNLEHDMYILHRVSLSTSNPIKTMRTPP